ncbi:MAG: sugar kinase [Bacteroidetes bacterium GWF2_38_335]|nr:MAG: sugar kinase [Bacteroidetes bacterium GWF2_38_335]OFY80353.1 MAG: sugar kinase [Bacteroidetes bacterium RIFOXYA12_FULL_38_20]HBS88845.1 sugar kinase [Bacteroidales bacterium]
MSLLIAGSIALDSIQSPFGKVSRTLGGAITYTSLAASYFVQKIMLVSIVGGDMDKKKLSVFRKQNIDLKGIMTIEEEKTFEWFGKYGYDLNSRETVYTKLNSMACFNPVLPTDYKNAKFLVLANFSPLIQMNIIKQMAIRPALILLDTSKYWIKNAEKQLLETIKMTDVLCVKDEEARYLTGEYSLLKAARAMAMFGPKYIIIRNGEHGVLLFHQNQIFYSPSLPLGDVLDPTGSGNSFTGGFTGYLSQSKNLSFDNMKKAVLFGSVMASFCVEKFGTDKLLSLTNKDISDRFEQFADLVQFNYEIN